MVPTERIRRIGVHEVRNDGDYVLYWMTAQRRSRFNYALDRALEWAIRCGKPLLVLEALRCDYPWASDRFHRFVIDGMADNQRAFADSPVTYLPYIEREKAAGKGLLAALASAACVVITDDYPAFFLPRMLAAAAAQVNCRFESVDGNGLLPMAVPDRVFTTAFSFRRYLQKQLPAWIARHPSHEPLRGLRLPPLSKPVPADASRWPMEIDVAAAASHESLAKYPIDHHVLPVKQRGGSVAAGEVLERFLDQALKLYPDDRNHPERNGTSGLSPYLHFGHISVHEIFHRLTTAEKWSPERLATRVTGQRAGFWGMSEATEGFLDELITWREIGFNMCHHRSDYAELASLPEWAQKTIAEHAGDERQWLYSLEQFERGETHDELWNAAQGQLVSEGCIHNYLRMLWGKKIYEWSPNAEHALSVMIELNNKYALDGRDPNSYSGIFWVLGRYDRAWGPERPIFGKLRYMTSESTRRKTKVHTYIDQYGRRALQPRLL